MLVFAPSIWHTYRTEVRGQHIQYLIDGVVVLKVDSPAWKDGGWVGEVSWDLAHWYMRFVDTGTERIPGQHFLEHALDRYAA